MDGHEHDSDQEHPSLSLPLVRTCLGPSQAHQPEPSFYELHALRETSPQCPHPHIPSARESHGGIFPETDFATRILETPPGAAAAPAASGGKEGSGAVPANGWSPFKDTLFAPSREAPAPASPPQGVITTVSRLVPVGPESMPIPDGGGGSGSGGGSGGVLGQEGRAPETEDASSVQEGSGSSSSSPEALPTDGQWRRYFDDANGRFYWSNGTDAVSQSPRGGRTTGPSAVLLCRTSWPRPRRPCSPE